MLLVDRYLGGHFFDTQAGGSAVIWMHLFWIFGHPEVYIGVIPAFSRKSHFRLTVRLCRLWLRDWRRTPRNTTVLRFLNRYLVNFESACSGAIKCNLRLCVSAFGGNFGRLRLRQIGLILDHEIIRRQPDVKGLLLHFYGLLLKNAALDS